MKKRMKLTLVIETGYEDEGFDIDWDYVMDNEIIPNVQITGQNEENPEHKIVGYEIDAYPDD